jgi:hypothetical protein
MKKTVYSFILALIALVIFSCSNDEPGTAYMEVRLTDAPGDYEEVTIDIQGVEVNSSTSADGWTSLDVKKGVYNILKLTNGIDTLLCNCGLPPGHISQIRLILGDNNSLKVDGQTEALPLSTPSGQQSGLKLNVNADLVEGITYKMLLDFDAARSVVKAGASGKYNLKPVIRAIAEAQSGAVKGVVFPLASSPAVYAIAGADTVGTAFADQLTGRFLIKGLAAGTYKITFQPATGFAVAVKENVEVTVGNVTDLGIITF